MSEQKGIPINVKTNCFPARDGLTPKELSTLMANGWLYLDVMSIRRKITTKEKLDPQLQVPPGATHLAEPMMVFYKVEPAMPPLPDKALEPGVN